MRNRFQNVMDGRHGSDQLNQFILIVALALVVINLFVSVSFLWLIGVILLIVAYIRMFSRNTVRREMENERFLEITSRFRRGGGGSRGFRGYQNGGSYGGGYGGSRGYQNGGAYSSRQENAERKRAQRQDKRYYKYFNCPNCNQKVRVPKGRGKIEISCPKCRTSFIRKT